jgi:putative ATP-dependent endonuclease of the OLD family
MQWGAQHFVRLHRNAVIESSNSQQTWRHFFAKYPDVKLLTRYMTQLGYEWDFWHDADQLSYVFLLVKDALRFSPDMFSSGEREIVHFLLAMFALNVTGGLVLVDEPELHLHPRWQKIFLGLFRDLAPERKCQFIITTHSPTFVTPDTINSITRVFREADVGSARVALKDVNLPEKKSLVRMINSQNNERLFFADKVILVEGITDRLVLGSLLESAAARFRNSVAVEIIEVGGKGNFRDYRSILAGLLTPSFVVADLDYLSEVGAEATRSLFRPNLEKQYEMLTADKKSLDRVALLERLGNAINEGETEELRHFWEYFRHRAMRLKEPRSEDEERAIRADIERLSLDNIFILRHGEIEDYLPPVVREVKSIVEALVDRNWINRIVQSDRRVELGHIICTVLNVPESERLPFLEELARGIVEFPEPGADVAKWSLSSVAVEPA